MDATSLSAAYELVIAHLRSRAVEEATELRRLRMELTDYRSVHTVSLSDRAFRDNISTQRAICNELASTIIAVRAEAHKIIYVK